MCGRLANLSMRGELGAHVRISIYATLPLELWTTHIFCRGLLL